MISLPIAISPLAWRSRPHRDLLSPALASPGGQHYSKERQGPRHMPGTALPILSVMILVSLASYNAPILQMREQGTELQNGSPQVSTAGSGRASLRIRAVCH